MIHDVLLFVMYRGLALVFDFAGDVSPICQELHDYQRAVVWQINYIMRCSGTAAILIIKRGIVTPTGR
jgi:hypothetical protein